MVTQTAVLENVVAERQPLVPIRERRWDKAQRRFVTVTVTPEMQEASRRREQYRAMFNPNGVA